MTELHYQFVDKWLDAKRLHIILVITIRIRGVASLARSGGQSWKPGRQSLDGKLLQYFKS